MQRVVGKVVVEDVLPEVGLRPVGQRVDLPDPAALVQLELGGGGAGGGLLAPDPGDPRLDALQAALERVDLRRRRSSWSPSTARPGLRASITSMRTPKRSSNCFQVASVSANSTPVSMVKIRTPGSIACSMCTSTDSSFWKEQAIVSRGWKRSTA